MDWTLALTLLSMLLVLSVAFKYINLHVKIRNLLDMTIKANRTKYKKEED